MWTNVFVEAVSYIFFSMSEKVCIFASAKLVEFFEVIALDLRNEGMKSNTYL